MAKNKVEMLVIECWWDCKNESYLARVKTKGISIIDEGKTRAEAIKNVADAINTFTPELNRILGRK